MTTVAATEQAWEAARRERKRRVGAVRAAFFETTRTAIIDFLEDHPRRNHVDLDDLQEHLADLLQRSEILQALDDLAAEGEIEVTGTDCGLWIELRDLRGTTPRPAERVLWTRADGQTYQRAAAP